MSTLAYAAMTNRREAVAPLIAAAAVSNQQRLSTFVDALAALVPAEVLTLHALILSVTTTVTATTAGNVTTMNPGSTLKWAFGGLIALSIVLYVVPRLPKWKMLDYLRAAIPPLAFVAWTMLQRSTAFDAVAPRFSNASRTVVGLFMAVLLGVLATFLARKAEQ